MENEKEINEKSVDGNNEGNSNPNLATDINSVDEEKLKGDAIGNTLYSERFVLKTLLKLKDNKWDEELENDMCTIWDMATEKDVVDFLLDNNFFEITIEVLLETKEQRLREILIGVIGNICVYPECAAKLIENEEVDTILREITSSDALVLIQTLRVYKALFHCNNIDHSGLLSDNQIEIVNYILQSSRNNELLLPTLQVAAEMIDKIKDKTFKYNFINSINEAFKEIFNYYYDKFKSQEFHKCICAYCKILENLCSVLNDVSDENKVMYKQIIQDNINATKATAACIEIILCIISDLEYIQTETESFEYYIYCSANFLVTFNTTFDEKIVLIFSNIFNVIVENNLQFEGAVNESITNFLIYIFMKTDSNIIRYTFKDWPKERLKKLFVNNIVYKMACNEKFILTVNTLCSS